MLLLTSSRCFTQLSKQEKEFRYSEGLAFFSGKVLTKRDEVKQSLQPLLLPKLNFNKLTLAKINEHLNKYDPPVASASMSRIYRRENPRQQLLPQIIETTILSNKRRCVQGSVMIILIPLMYSIPQCRRYYINLLSI
jgi:hypothetical protein